MSPITGGPGHERAHALSPAGLPSPGRTSPSFTRVATPAGSCHRAYVPSLPRLPALGLFLGLGLVKTAARPVQSQPSARRASCSHLPAAASEALLSPGVRLWPCCPQHLPAPALSQHLGSVPSQAFISPGLSRPLQPGLLLPAVWPVSALCSQRPQWWPRLLGPAPRPLVHPSQLPGTPRASILLPDGPGLGSRPILSWGLSDCSGERLSVSLQEGGLQDTEDTRFQKVTMEEVTCTRRK